ncbi:MAG: baseplate J/gp47 family protein [Saprospiraceae bacterium]|nr:baseplate J/gp47 family protein [Saprospiraceae bacterium]
MSETCKHSNPLKREGTTQIQRLLDALVPENVKLHELDVEDWMKFARNYASQINYYKHELPDGSEDETGTFVAENFKSGDWEDFFIDEDEVSKFLASSEDGNLSPHLSLFIAFLNLLQHPQESLNLLPKRHLDFYYKDVLRLEPKSFTADSVHLIFELAKNAVSELVGEESRLEAGKDSSGKILNYHLDKNIVVNPAKVTQLKAISLNDGSTLKYASDCKTVDGIEEPLEDNASWSAFGDDQWTNNLPAQAILSSDVLLMKEGKRTVTITWETAQNLPITGTAQAIVTGEKGWLDPVNVDIDVNPKTWTFVLPEDMDAVGGYVEKVHERTINTSKPTVIISFADDSNYGAFQGVTITSCTISVEVEGITNLIVKNELGTQTGGIPFMPFGPRPKKNSKLSIEVEEFNNKNITGFDINMPWLNMPANFTTHYDKYEDAIAKQKEEEFNNSWYLQGNIPNKVIVAGIIEQEEYVFGDIDPGESILKLESDELRADFKVMVSSVYNNSDTIHEMFNEPLIAVSGNQVYTKGGAIEVRLLSSFYHDLYNSIYVSAITADTTIIDTSVTANSTTIVTGIAADSLPKEPYTPLTSGLSINYRAESTVTFDTSLADVKEVEFHHSSPFGTELKKESTTLVPQVLRNSLFIGLEGALPRNVISLLFQVAEGTEDPSESTFQTGEDIQWSVLDENGSWLSLDKDYILSNATNNFLTSGIVEITLPRETGLDHFQFDSNMVWLKVSMNKVPSSVCKFYDIYSQAALATFKDSSNALDHLSAGLDPGKIKQLAQRKSKIKGVSQPYTSFGGKSTESDSDFYRRTSERLRHKDRALTIWDYERLILQDFPQIHKAKCLNHTKKEDGKVDEVYPGAVTIVVIPKIKEAGSEYMLEPKVSQNTKDEIKAYLMPKKPLHVELGVENPIYEKVRFAFEVKFYDGFDYEYYKTVIKEDIKGYISPWIKEEEQNLTFGRSIYKYEVINFIENLEYVDYLEDFNMSHEVEEGVWEVKNEIFPTNSLAILVAHSDHDISEATTC